MRFEIVPGLVPAEAFALAQAVGWDRTEAGIQRDLALQPDGAFSARGPEGEALGIVTCALWGELAWIGSMIVAEHARRLGIGRALLDSATRFAEAHGARTIGLDATPEGRALYERAGFEATWGESARWTKGPGVAGPRPSSASSVAIYPVSPAEIMELVQCDTPRFGAPRGRLLAALMAERPHQAFVAVDRTTKAFVGHALALDGRIGPLVADTPDAAARLLAAIERAGAAPVAIVPAWNAAAEKVFADAGYQKGRACVRMTKGAPLAGRAEAIYAIGAWALG